MTEGCEHLGFPLKPADPICIAREFFRQNLDRHFAFQLQIASTIHLAHATFAEECRDLMRTELGPYRDWHVVAAIIDPYIKAYKACRNATRSDSSRFVNTRLKRVS